MALSHKEFYITMCVMQTMASAQDLSSELITLSRDPVFREPPPSPGTSPLGCTYISYQDPYQGSPIRDHMPIQEPSPL